MMYFDLNQENMYNIPFNEYEKNFTFIVDNQKYMTNRIIADILSPTIRNLHYTDKSANEYCFNTKINQNNKKSYNKVDYFNEFLQLSTYKKIDLDENRKNYFSEYFLQLGNIEEYFRLNSKYYSDVTNENVIDYLIDLLKFQTKIFNEFRINSSYESTIFSSKVNQKLINFISLNFETINKKRMKELEPDLIEQIISNESLRLFDEDTLLLFLLELFREDDKYSPLFEYVIFSNVREETLNKFINSFSIEFMNNSIWKSISARLFQSKIESKIRYTSNKSSNKFVQFHQNISEFEYHEGGEFNGILRHLSNQSKGNIHDNGLIEITSNSIVLNLFHPKNLVDYNNDNYYFSKDVSNSFVCFDFKDKSVKLSSYSIKSHNDGKNYAHLKNWVIEVSIDAKSWKIIDNQKNCSLLNGSNLVANFKIDKKDDDDEKFYRYIRIRSSGNSWYQYGNHSQIYFSLIEFFGQIKNDD